MDCHCGGTFRWLSLLTFQNATWSATGEYGIWNFLQESFESRAKTRTRDSRSKKLLDNDLDAAAAIMTMKRLLFAITLLIFCLRNIIVATHVYSDSFPTNDEYDFNVLDPHHIYGSPYGGFGRATRSRLAALPLHLPGTVGEFHTGEGEFYMEMRDGDGRLFACRTYHEDELTQDSLAESMFTTAQLTGISEISEDIEDQDVSDTTDVDVVAEEETVEKEEEQDAESIDEAIDLHQVLSKLNGVCTQIHKGWWSYEWCHGSKVTQFHVHVESGKQIQLQDITSLGSFSKSTIYEDGDPDAQPELNDAVAEKVKQFTGETEDDPKEVAVVVYDFENGDKCPETNRPRTTKVKLKCCPLKRMNRLKRAVLFHGDQVASNIAAITKMQETSVCNYYLEVCTPLLCEGVADLFQDGLIAKETVAGSEGNIVPTPMTTREKKGTGSIREILGGTLNNVCLRFFNGGWYVLFVA